MYGRQIYYLTVYILHIFCEVHRKIYKLNTFNIAQGTWMGIIKQESKNVPNTKNLLKNKKQTNKRVVNQ